MATPKKKAASKKVTAKSKLASRSAARSSKKASASNDALFAQLDKAGFTSDSPNIYVKGGKRVELSSEVSDQGKSITHTKFYGPDSETPLFHTNAGVTPTKEFMEKFLAD